MGNSESKPGYSPQMSPEDQEKGIPPVIRATYQNTWSKLVCWTSVSLNLGEPGSDSTYSVSLPKGWYGDVILHNGPDTGSMPLASGARDRVCRSSDYSITLPPLPGSGFDGGLEILRRPSGMKGRWWFGIQVGQGAERHIERFEWRRSHGSEVKSVGQSRWGWKLVRLGSSKEEEAYSSDEEMPDERDGFTSDGKEVVAVWAGSSCWKSFSSVVGELRFRGSGLTGELGTPWALMVVMSCMAIWQKAMRDMATAGATSTTSSTVVAVS
ncbi:hypothetical protein ACHAPT_003233 [Fusarium lateritium]